MLRDKDRQTGNCKNTLRLSEKNQAFHPSTMFTLDEDLEKCNANQDNIYMITMAYWFFLRWVHLLKNRHKWRVAFLEKWTIL